MADLTITAASVIAGSNAKTKSVTWGTTITAGKVVQEDPATGKWTLADNNSGTTELRRPGGIALSGGGDGQPGWVHLAGDITIGAALTAGARYYLSETPGGIQPEADLVTTGEYVAQLGLAKTTTVLTVDIQFPNVAI